jgi:hypothetical protein
MSATGWKQLLAGWPWFRGEGRFPLPAYSELMPPPYLVRKPYGGWDLCLLRDDDPHGWPVTEYEEALALRPGLVSIARQLLRRLVQCGRDPHRHDIAHGKLVDNPYWSLDLARQAAGLKGERYVLLLPLALSRTLDDKGRVRWTLFGGSEQGPARAFWRGFFTAPDREAPAAEGLDFFRRLLRAAYAVPDKELDDLHRAGLRVLPQGDDVPCPWWREGPLPSWAEPLLWEPGRSLRGVKYLLTFRPFLRLPAAVRRAYQAGDLHLLPFPGSLLFWGVPGYVRLQRELPFALQVPLLQQVDRHEEPLGIRVPQAGWLHEAREAPPPEHQHGPVRGTFKRTHRWARVHRDEDELATAREEKLAHVLFSAAPDDVGLYYKPMARNAQLWTHDFRLLFDGPRADYDAICAAAEAVGAGGVFGYRFLYPAMRLGTHELYWHRPLVAYRTGRGGTVMLPDAPAGYLTAYDAGRPDLERPVELWPRLLQRPLHAANVELFEHAKHDPRPQQTLINVRKFLDTWELLGGRPLQGGPLAGASGLCRSFARRLLTTDKRQTLDGWLDSLPARARDPGRARALADELRRRLEPEPPRRRKAKRPRPAPSLTYRHTARRSFEVEYWKTIAFLSAGDYVNKNNADPVRDPATQAVHPHDQRDLEPLGAYLLTYYTQLIESAGLAGKALVGELPFRWQTEFHYPWMGGWLHNREHRTHERDLVVVIPGRDRSRAVLMADHYDTAYMEDHYEKARGGTGARIAAPGADDNCSATAALMLGARPFLELSRADKLGCDVWLIHLTGEEYPAEGLGARHLCQCLVEGRLKIRLAGDRWHDLSDTAVKGLVVLDMVAHNVRADRDVFQMSPGTSRESMWLAYQAHLAAEAWNESLPAWNGRADRRDAGRARRSRDRGRVPGPCRHLYLDGEVRPSYDPRSTLFNTDGDEFSDAGLPTLLFMENYDINRVGYHDTHDTMGNIDLDYGSALAAITIEAVARMATEEPPAP